MQFLNKSHDHCPFCRKRMLKPEEMRVAAREALGEKRFARLVWLDEHVVLVPAVWQAAVDPTNQ
jgi:hypothetical protein